MHGPVELPRLWPHTPSVAPASDASKIPHIEIGKCVGPDVIAALHKNPYLEAHGTWQLLMTGLLAHLWFPQLALHGLPFV